jgi:hypothetical protein
MTNSERLEREADQTRAELLGTLQELRRRMTPGQVVDQLVDYARDSGGGAFFRNLGRQVADNPLPLTLMGASLAWLMVSGSRPAARQGAAAALGEDVADAGREATAAMGDAARRVSTGAREGASRIGDAAAGATASIGERASALYGNAASRAGHAADAIGSSASTVGRQVSARSHDLIELCREQPLVLAGIGIAVGAAIGAMLPSTEAENRLLGEASDKLKQRTRDMAGEQYDKAKTVAATAAAAASEEASKTIDAEAQRQGLGKVGDRGTDAVAQRMSASSENPDRDGQAADRGTEPGGLA